MKPNKKGRGSPLILDSKTSKRFIEWVKRNPKFFIDKEKCKNDRFGFKYCVNGPTAILKQRPEFSYEASALAMEAVIEFRNLKKPKEKLALRQLKKRNLLSKLDYKSYIKSDQWKSKSIQCISDAGHECEVCGSSQFLEAHHFNYVFLGAEKPIDLFCLCSSCHIKYHLDYPSNKLPHGRGMNRKQRLVHLQQAVLKRMKQQNL